MGALPCQTNPFAGVMNPRATVLLPAATIAIQAPWILPSNTKIVGYGRNLRRSLQHRRVHPDGTNALIEMGAMNPSSCTASNQASLCAPRARTFVPASQSST